jgi:hypothetical protein
MSVSCECCVLSGRGLCDGLITRPEESYRLWCVSNVCDHETSTKRGGPGPYRAVEPWKKKVGFQTFDLLWCAVNITWKMNQVLFLTLIMHLLRFTQNDDVMSITIVGMVFVFA